MYHKEKRLWPLLLHLGIPLAVGGASYLLTGRKAMESYARLPQPPLAPPGWLFPVVWTVLYGLMGLSAWLVWRKKGRRRALEPYALQLLLNGLWTPVFFRLRLWWAALAVLAALEGTILWMIAAFRRVDRRAGNLQLPYALWVAFAGYLNAAVAMMQG